MMNNKIASLVLKKYLFPVIGLTIVLSALPFSVWQISQVQQTKTEASSFFLIPYPGLSWSVPKPYNVSFLRYPKTADEIISFSDGQAVTAETEKDISNEIYFFYNQLLTSKGYAQIQLTGNPTEKKQWVASYELEGNICQLQYYDTPYVHGHHTVLLFFGNI